MSQPPLPDLTPEQRAAVVAAVRASQPHASRFDEAAAIQWAVAAIRNAALLELVEGGKVSIRMTHWGTVRDFVFRGPRPSTVEPEDPDDVVRPPAVEPNVDHCPECGQHVVDDDGNCPDCDKPAPESADATVLSLFKPGDET